MGIDAGASPPANAGDNSAPDPVGRSSSGGRGISAGLDKCPVSYPAVWSRTHVVNCVAGFDWRGVGELADRRTNSLCDDPRKLGLPSVPISLETLSSNSLMSRAKEIFNVSRLIIIKARESITR